jgi:hypothetical protein
MNVSIEWWVRFTIITLFQKEQRFMLVNRHRWFFTESKFNATSRELEAIDYNDDGRRKKLYLSNDGRGTPTAHTPKSGPDALPAGVIVDEWYPKSLCELQTRLNIRLTDESIANLRTPLAIDDWYVAATKRLYPNFPVDVTLRKEGRSGDNRVDA